MTNVPGESTVRVDSGVARQEEFGCLTSPVDTSPLINVLIIYENCTKFDLI